MSVRYNEDFKKEVVRTYMAGNKSTVQIAADYNIAKSTVSQWVNQYKEECLYTTNTTSESNEAKEIRKLNQMLKEKFKIRNTTLRCLLSRNYSRRCDEKRLSYAAAL